MSRGQESIEREHRARTETWRKASVHCVCLIVSVCTNRDLFLLLLFISMIFSFVAVAPICRVLISLM